MYFSPQKQKFIDAAVEMFGDGVVLDKQGVRDASVKAGVSLKPLPADGVKTSVIAAVSLKIFICIFL